MSSLRRVRGYILRLAQGRFTSAVLGSTFLLFSLGLIYLEFSWESWLSDGLGLVLAATGTALILMSFSGRRPDWVEPE